MRLAICEFWDQAVSVGSDTCRACTMESLVHAALLDPLHGFETGRVFPLVASYEELNSLMSSIMPSSFAKTEKNKVLLPRHSLRKNLRTGD